MNQGTIGAAIAIALLMLVVFIGIRKGWIK